MTTITYAGRPMLARVGTVPPSRPALERLADLDAQNARYTRIAPKPRRARKAAR